MSIENETPEEKLLREEREKNEITLTPEQEDALIKKRFGVGADQLIKKEDIPVVLSEEDKKKLDEQKKAQALTTGLEQGWFKKEDYDQFQQLTATGKIEIARKKFIDDHPELGKDAESTFNDLFHVNEEDEIEEDEVMKPNTKKKVAVGVAEKMADEYIKSKYSSIINAESKFEERENLLKTGAANLVEIKKKIAAIPDEIEIVVEGIEDFKIEGLDGKFKFKITPEDRSYVEGIFGKDKNLLASKDIASEKLTEDGIVAIQVKRISSLISEAVTTALTKAQEAYERGEKGIIPDRNTKNASGNAAVEWMKEKGIQV